MEKEAVKKEVVKKPVPQPIPQELNQQQAINVLIQGVRVAQTKGAFTLEDAELLAKAIRVFIPNEPRPQDEADPAVNNEVKEEGPQG